MAKRKTKSILFAWRTAVIQSQMKPMRRVVLLGFAEHMNAARGDSCWPADETVGEEIGYSRQTVNTHKKEAIRDGWLLQRPREKKAESGKSTYKYHAHLPEGHPAWRHLSSGDAAYLKRTATEWRNAMESVESDGNEGVGKVEETPGIEQATRRGDAPASASGDGQAAPSRSSTATDSQPVNGQKPACQWPESQPVNGQEGQPVRRYGQAESHKPKRDNDPRSSPTKSHLKLSSQGGSHSLGGSTRERAQASQGEPAPPVVGSPVPRHVPTMPRPDADGYYRCTQGCGSIVGGPRVICAKCRVARVRNA